MVLTTNFDRLIETAFERFSMPLQVVPVSVRGRLPDPRIVRSQNCLVKLHGEVLETRADFSLDDEPTDDDKTAFASYLTETPDSGIAQAGRSSADALLAAVPRTRRLLVVGYSGSDARCIQLIKYFLDRDIDGYARVYWICHSERDKNRLPQLFSEAGYAGRFVVAQTPRPDLLLYELYQCLMLCLPPGGLTYEFSHNVPPVREPEFDSVERDRDTVVDGVQSGKQLLREAASAVHGDSEVKHLARDVIVETAGQEVLRHLTGRPASESALGGYIAVTTPKLTAATPGIEKIVRVSIASGAVRALRIPFYKLAETPGRHCLWFELQDYTNPDALGGDIARTIALRVGRFQLQHVSLHPVAGGIERIAEPFQSLIGASTNSSAEPAAVKARQAFVRGWKDQLQEFRVDPVRWTLFIYGRDSPGGTAGWSTSPWTWKTYHALDVLLGCLAEVGFGIVHIPQPTDREQRKLASLRRWSTERPPAMGHPNTPNPKEVDRNHQEYRKRFHEPATPSSAYSKDVGSASELSIFDDLMESVRADIVASQSSFYRRTLFIYSLTLFRQARHPSSMFSEGTFQCPFRFNAFGVDNDWIRAEETTEWLKTLRNRRVLYDKLGGYLWMHRDIRIGLQCWLETLRLDAFDNRASCTSQSYFLGEVRARLHFWIGDWYYKAYVASGHMTPLIESIYHRIQAAQFARWARPRSVQYDRKDEIVSYRAVLARSALAEISKTLEMARPSLKLWLAGAVAGPMWSNGGLKPLRGQLLAATELFPSSWKFSRRKARKYFEERGHLNRMVADVIGAFADIGNAIVSEGGGMHKRRYRPPLVIRERTFPLTNGTEVSQDVIAIAARDEDFAADFRKRFDELGAADLLTQIESPPTSPGKIGDVERRISDEKAKWLLNQPMVGVRIHELIWLLGEFAYLLLRRAKLGFHASGGKSIDFPSWQKASIACNVGIDLCKHMSPALLQDELLAKVKFHAIYALALANLGRSFEAHRHLNEAHAILSKADTASPDTETATLCLRRSEVHITQCYWIKQFLEKCGGEIERGPTKGVKDRKYLRHLAANGLEWQSRTWMFCGLGTAYPTSPAWRTEDIREILATQHAVVPPLISECLRRASDDNDFLMQLGTLYSATLDDAWVELDRAGVHLAGASHSSLWWGRLATLRLRVFGLMLRDRPTIVNRKEEDREFAIEQTYSKAMRITAFDAYRKLRVIDYFVDAVSAYRVAVCDMQPFSAHGPEVIHRLEECRVEIKDMTVGGASGSFDAYHRNVAARVEKQWPAVLR